MRSGELSVARPAHGDKLILGNAVLDVHVLPALLGDCSFPGKVIAPRRLVVVAHEQARLGRERQKPFHRAIERVLIAAWKVGAGRAEVRHEQGVPDEHRILDPIGDIGRRVSGRIDHLALHRADREALAVLEQVVELAAVAADVGGVKDGAKDLLHLANMLADANLGAGCELDIGRARHMIGMRVRLQHPVDRRFRGLRRGKDRLRRS